MCVRVARVRRAVKRTTHRDDGGEGMALDIWGRDDIANVLKSAALMNEASCRSAESRAGFALALAVLATGFGIETDGERPRHIGVYEWARLREQRGLRIP